MREENEPERLSPNQDTSEQGAVGEELDLRNILGFLNQSLYHDYMNITNIMKLKRLDFRDIYGIRCPDLLLTRESIIERIMLLITSYFRIGTELRFLKHLEADDEK